MTSWPGVVKEKDVEDQRPQMGKHGEMRVRRTTVLSSVCVVHTECNQAQ